MTSTARITQAPDGRAHNVSVDGRDIARLYTVNGEPYIEPLPSSNVTVRGYAPSLQTTSNVTSGDIAAYVSPSDESSLVIRPPYGESAITLPRRLSGGIAVPDASSLVPISGAAEMMHTLASGIALRQPVLIEGPPGVGKTHGTEWLGAMLGYNVFTLQVTPNLEADDLIGSMAPRLSPTTGDSYLDFVPNIVLAAVVASQTHPTILILDELNRIRQQGATASLYGLLAKGCIDVIQQPQSDGSPTRYDAGDLYIVATQNPSAENDPNGTYETNDLDDALKSRFVRKWLCDFPTVDEEVNIIAHNVPTADRNVSEAVCKVAYSVRTSDDCGRYPLSNRLLVAYMQSVSAGTSTHMAFRTHIANSVPAYIRDAVMMRGAIEGIANA